jgi:8-oxo-dGTP pyrophosphatase MutT (NUDIX family)
MLFYSSLYVPIEKSNKKGGEYMKSVREEIIAELTAYVPNCDQHHVDACRNFVLSGAALTRDEGNTSDQLTGSIMVLSEDGTKALMCKHKKLNRWLQLGGHVDTNELPSEAAIREVFEESGIRVKDITLIDVDVHVIPYSEKKKEAEHKHYDFRYVATVDGNTVPVVSDESDEVCWVPVTELTSMVDESAIGFLRLVSKVR